MLCVLSGQPSGNYHPLVMPSLKQVATTYDSYTAILNCEKLPKQTIKTGAIQHSDGSLREVLSKRMGSHTMLEPMQN